MIDLDRFCDLLRQEGIRFVTGVPDTLLNDFCLKLDDVWSGNCHVIAANEGNAIALAAGYHLATGSIPLVYMQNSGLGNAMNPLISLSEKAVYSIPMVLMVGWRGEPGSNDWPQHQRQGELTPILLDTLNIPYRTLDPDEESALAATKWAVSTSRTTNLPTALLVRKGVLAQSEKAGFDSEDQPYPLSRAEAIAAITSCVPSKSIFVATTGRATRELHALRESRNETHDQDFLNVGAMGHTLSIACGIAAAQKDRPVICLDGDGAAIMHMGSMPVVAALKFSGLLHVVINNGAHESVGGQRTAAFDADLTSIAAAAGYVTLGQSVQSRDEIQASVRNLLNAKSSAFLEIKIKKGMRKDTPVLKMDPKTAKKQFMQHLGVRNA